MRRAATFGLNAQFYAGYLLYSAAAIPALALAVAAAAVFVPHRAAMRRFRRAISWYGKGVIRVLPWPWVRVRYEPPPPGDPPGPYLFVANHRAASDAYLLACLPEEVVQVVNLWPFRLPVLGFFARRAGYLSVRALPFAEFLARAGRLLAEGASVAAFPEGTRSGSRAMGPFHGAVFRLAHATRAPIVPLCISGNERIPPRGSLRLEPGRIRVRRLPAIPWEHYRDLTAFALKNRVRDAIQRELDAMERPAAESAP